MRQIISLDKDAILFRLPEMVRMPDSFSTFNMHNSEEGSNADVG